MRILTCIECPIGCTLRVEIENGKAKSIEGNACPRGRIYAENEVSDPKRVITSTVRAKNGKLVPVKTDKPARKEEIFSIMEKIGKISCDLPVKIGDVLEENISNGVNLIATSNEE